MGRTPDFEGAWIGTFGLNNDLYGEYADIATRWYNYARERLPFINHAMVNPPIDRNGDPNQSDVFVRVVEETAGVLYISGAKVVATGAALTQYTFVAHYNVMYEDKKYSPIFMVPIGAKGVKLICRSSYELSSNLAGSPFDNPLSSRPIGDERLVVLNSVAKSIIEKQRGTSREWVFPYNGTPMHRMNDSAWKKARERAAKLWQEKNLRPAHPGYA